MVNTYRESPWPFFKKPLSSIMGFLGDSVVKNLPANAGDEGDASPIPVSRRFPGGWNGSPLQYSCLEKPMDRGAWWTIVHRITKSQTWQSMCTCAHIYTSSTMNPLHGSLSCPDEGACITQQSKEPCRARSLKIVQPQKWQNNLGSFPRQTTQHHSNPSLYSNHWCWRSWSWSVWWRPIRPPRTNTKTKKKKSYSSQGIRMQK